MCVCNSTFSCLQVCGQRCWRRLVCWQSLLTVWSLESHLTLFLASSIVTVMAHVRMERLTHSQSCFSLIETPKKTSALFVLSHHVFCAVTAAACRATLMTHFPWPRLHTKQLKTTLCRKTTPSTSHSAGKTILQLWLWLARVCFTKKHCCGTNNVIFLHQVCS